MFRKILFWGTVAGLVVGAILFGTTVSMAGKPPSMGLGMLIGYTSMLLALSAIFVGVKRHRDEQLGGVIGFWPALGMGLGITLVAGVFYVLAWEAAARPAVDAGASVAFARTGIVLAREGGARLRRFLRPRDLPQTG